MTIKIMIRSREKINNPKPRLKLIMQKWTSIRVMINFNNPIMKGPIPDQKNMKVEKIVGYLLIKRIALTTDKIIDIILEK